jgi:hypothetical protein
LSILHFCFIVGHDFSRAANLAKNGRAFQAEKLIAAVGRVLAVQSHDILCTLFQDIPCTFCAFLAGMMGPFSSA